MSFALELPPMTAKRVRDAVLLFVGWMLLGTLFGIAGAVLIGILVSFVTFPHHSTAAPGDGILLMLIVLIVVPIGGLLGLVRALVVLDRRRIAD
jgi:hypothetical protein